MHLRSVMNSAHAFDHRSVAAESADLAPIVFVLDEDMSVRASLELLIRCQGWQPKTFGSVNDFSAQPRPLVPSCLLLSPPDPSSLDLQRQIARERPEMSIIITSSYGDIPTAVQAMKAGAVDVVAKPFRNGVLLDAIHQGIERSRLALERESEIRDLQDRYASVSPREREVMTLVVAGLLNKQIGGRLGISEITVKSHRGRVMRKMDAASLPALVHMAAALGIAGRQHDSGSPSELDRKRRILGVRARDW